MKHEHKNKKSIFDIYHKQSIVKILKNMELVALTTENEKFHLARQREELIEFTEIINFASLG